MATHTCAYDFFIPLFPLKKIADIYKESKELGFVYGDLPWGTPSFEYQVGCPSECKIVGYSPSVLVNTTSVEWHMYCTILRYV